MDVAQVYLHEFRGMPAAVEDDDDQVAIRERRLRGRRGSYHNYWLPSLGFCIFPVGRAIQQNYSFVLDWDHPYMQAPDGSKIPIILDQVTGFPWIAERPYAEPTIRTKQTLCERFKDSTRIVEKPDSPSDDLIELMPSEPDTKDSIDARLSALDQFQSGEQGGEARAPGISVRRYKLL